MTYSCRKCGKTITFEPENPFDDIGIMADLASLGWSLNKKYGFLCPDCAKEEEEMSKAMLVLDEMPIDCGSNGINGDPCILAVIDCETDDFICAKTGKRIEGFRGFGKRPSFCPLRPLPEKKWIDPHDVDMFDHGEAYGWNACLDAITGGDHEQSTGN